MPGKCRPSLIAKTLENVKRSNLSQTDKDCIAEIFKRYETKVDIVLCKECNIYKVYIGSSKMNTKEMTELLDITLQICGELGIPTEMYDYEL